MADRRSPIASLISDDAPKMFLKSGLFERISAPGTKVFEQNEPNWMSVVKPGEKKS